MCTAHSTVVERQVPVCDLTARPGPAKVARIITRLNIGGPAIHTVLLTREMAALGYRTLLVAGSCEPEDGDMSYLLRDEDAVRRVADLSRSIRPWRNLKALWKLRQLLRHERPAIVHTHTAMAGCLGRLAALLSGTPIIIHTFHGNSLTEYFSPVQSRIFRGIEQLLARFTDVLCVVSPQQAVELSAKFHIAPPSRFRVIPLGLDLSEYFELRPPGSTGPFTVGWFGRMVPIKDISLLAATIRSALQRSSEIRFVIAGDGPDQPLLNDVLNRFPERVTWLGWQRELLPAMTKCDVLLQTSRNEGTPVALMQGMAAARPFVSTAVGGVVDMVAGAMERETADARWYSNGVLCEHDPAALASVLVTLTEDRILVSRMGLAGRSVAASRYQKETLVANMDHLYRELLEVRRNKP